MGKLGKKERRDLAVVKRASAKVGRVERLFYLRINKNRGEKIKWKMGAVLNWRVASRKSVHKR